MLRSGAVACALLLSLARCGGDSTPPDGAVDLGHGDLGTMDSSASDAPGGDMPSVCRSDADCDDGIFCNGVSRCTPGDAMADARGCVPMTGPPCATGQTCSEPTHMCLSMCDVDGDADHDGHRSTTCGGDDCDDSDPTSFPTNTETCDPAGHDEDCDPATLGPDRDGDGFVSTGCCNRNEAGALVCGTDCDDTTMDVSPTAPEVCDGVDDNCDGRVDEGVLATFFHDLDGDGIGDSTMSRMGCSAPSGYVLTGGDCDDSHAAVHPGAAETCNMIDDDCNGTVDDAPGGCMCTIGSTTNCGPSDGMGGFLMVGPCHGGTESCLGGTLGPCEGAISPTAESCNGVDDDCDGVVDDGVTSTYYRDADGDGYGDGTMSMASCGAPMGYAPVPNDCDDTRAATYPGATETCNGRDDNCNGSVDEGVTTTFYRDADGDGYGSPTDTVDACAAPSGYVTMTGDCNDASATIHPGAADPCDMIDNNCDGTVDPGCSCTNGMMQPCGTSDGMGGFLMVGICHPGSQTCVTGMWGSCSGDVGPVPETCNMLDDDCNGVVDDGVLTNWYRDCDNDHYGASGTTPTAGCVMPATPPAACPSGTWVANATDCNDAAPAVHPGVAEVCNHVDDDCDGVADGAPATAACMAAAPLNESSVCVFGTCSNTCIAPYLDCNAAAAGCESNSSTDYAHCGACATSCYVHTCVGGSCIGDVVQLAVGRAHACGRRRGGDVVCWGDNTYGQLGDGTTTNRSTFVVVPGVTGVTSLVAGADFTCALLSGGTAMCWGHNATGQLGDGTTTDRHTPTAVSGLSGVSSLVAGADFACANFAAGGTPDCWGGNAHGQLANGGTTRSATPRAIDSSVRYVMAAGFSHACGRTGGSTLSCWGANDHGQLGDGTTTESHVPVACAPSVDGRTAISGPMANHTCTTDGLCWGANGNGQIGNGSTTDELLPLHITIGSFGPAAVALGADFTFFFAGGAAYSTGDDANGQLADGATTMRLTPGRVIAAGTAQSAGTSFACGLVPVMGGPSGGSVYCWGANASGQVGDGTTTERHSPTHATGL